MSLNRLVIQMGNRLQIDRRPPWTPVDLATVMWFDASDTSTITDTAGDVTKWDDKSGNNNFANGGDAPETGNRTLGGLNVIDFDGVSEYLNVESDTTRDNNDYIVIGVYDCDATAKALHGQSGAQAMWWGMHQMVLATDGTTAYSTPAGTGPNIVSCLVNYSATTMKAFVNDVEQASDTMTASIGHGTFRLGVNYSLAFDFNGGMAEVIMMNDITQDTIDKVTGYLAWKWDGGNAGTLVGKLPSNHPYKYVRPSV